LYLLFSNSKFKIKTWEDHCNVNWLFYFRNYFGLRCSRFCKTLADGNTNFTCSENGEKICRPGWAGENCSRIEEDGGGNLVISRLVGGKHKSHVFPSMKQHTGKQIFVLSGDFFVSVFKMVFRFGVCHP
ncbi:delta serrate ligand, partial [Cooperia oncophora]